MARGLAARLLPAAAGAQQRRLGRGSRQLQFGGGGGAMAVHRALGKLGAVGELGRGSRLRLLVQQEGNRQAGQRRHAACKGQGAGGAWIQGRKARMAGAVMRRAVDPPRSSACALRARRVAPQTPRLLEESSVPMKIRGPSSGPQGAPASPSRPPEARKRRPPLFSRAWSEREGMRKPLFRPMRKTSISMPCKPKWRTSSDAASLLKPLETPRQLSQSPAGQCQQAPS